MCDLCHCITVSLYHCTAENLYYCACLVPFSDAKFSSLLYSITAFLVLLGGDTKQTRLLATRRGQPLHKGSSHKCELLSPVWSVLYSALYCTVPVPLYSTVLYCAVYSAVQDSTAPSARGEEALDLNSPNARPSGPPGGPQGPGEAFTGCWVQYSAVQYSSVQFTVVCCNVTVPYSVHSCTVPRTLHFSA